MLDTIGAGAMEDLAGHLPGAIRFQGDLNIAPGQSEYEIMDYFRARGAENVGAAGAGNWASFLGAGVYHHYRPVMVDAIISRGEFLTSYTPYQAEISQGTLTAIFEFQSMICQLTGMDVANASMYDGSTAMPEAALMAMRITGRGGVLVARSVHPEYREVLHTYARFSGIAVEEIGFDAASGALDLEDLARKITEDTAAVIVQSPNFFGIVEDIRPAAALAHEKGALLVDVFSEAVALGVLEPPHDADIVCGELQSFAISPSYGGPFAGVIACKERFIRQIPGRLVGETRDAAGNRAFCLTLATREQHIRREKATSNICTNQALIALMATVFMSVYGKEGLRELGVQNLSKAHYLGEKMKRRFSGPFFNEFVADAAGRDIDQMQRALETKRIVGGLPLRRYYPELAGYVLLCCTEMTRREHMDQVAEVFA